METHARSIAKAVSYRILGSTATTMIVFVMTGKASISMVAGVADMVVKVGVYFIHERIWDRIPYGRDNKRPDFEI